MRALPLIALLLAAAAAPVLAEPLAVTDAEARAQTKPIKAKKIILVGDSTTAVQSGWGSSFCGYKVSSFLTCVNLARGGRSTFSYRAEGSWDLALAEMKTPGYGGVYVLIQFGHNDQPGKPGRSTDLEPEFADNIRHYILDTRAAGAVPILLTPLTRRSFKDGKLQNDLQPWAMAIRRVGTELDAPVIDLNARSAELVQSLGAEKAAELARAAPSSEVPPATQSETLDDGRILPFAAFDYTHLGRKGADVFADLVAMDLAKAVPELKGDLYR